MSLLGQLPSEDRSFLETSGLTVEVSSEEAGMLCVVFRGWPLPPGFNYSSADLLVRLSAGYPDTAPDMWWFSPALTTEGGCTIQATEIAEVHLGRTWQRWSRHLSPGQWQSGVDGLENYLALIHAETERCARPVAA